MQHARCHQHAALCQQSVCSRLTATPDRCLQERLAMKAKAMGVKAVIEKLLGASSSAAACVCVCVLI